MFGTNRIILIIAWNLSINLLYNHTQLSLINCNERYVAEYCIHPRAQKPAPVMSYFRKTFSIVRYFLIISYIIRGKLHLSRKRFTWWKCPQLFDSLYITAYYLSFFMFCKYHYLRSSPYIFSSRMLPPTLDNKL